MINLPACKPIAAYDEITEEEWLELRKTGIGGSDAGAITGLSKYGSALTVCLEKTGRYKPDDISEEEPVKVGNILEPLIRREIVGPYIRETEGIGVEVIDPTHMYRSIEHPFMLVNVDGFLHLYDRADLSLGQDGMSIEPKVRTVGLEIKTGSSYMLKYWGGKDGDEVPDSYYAQVQHYMAATGLSEFWIFALIGNARLLRKVPRNDPWIADLIEKERQTWDAIEKNDPLYFPMPTGLDAETDALFQYGNPQQEETVDLSDIAQSIRTYESAKREAKQYTEWAEQKKQEIMLALGTAKYGEADGFKVAFSRVNRSSFDKKQFMKDHPGLIDPYVTTTESGRLTVKAIE
jgi:putative phage-type endonuclease